MKHHIVLDGIYVFIHISEVKNKEGYYTFYTKVGKAKSITERGKGHFKDPVMNGGNETNSNLRFIPLMNGRINIPGDDFENLRTKELKLLNNINLDEKY